VEAARPAEIAQPTEEFQSAAILAYEKGFLQFVDHLCSYLQETIFFNVFCPRGNNNQKNVSAPDSGWPAGFRLDSSRSAGFRSISGRFPAGFWPDSGRIPNAGRLPAVFRPDSIFLSF
jgi:hypothetical protein